MFSIFPHSSRYLWSYFPSVLVIIGNLCGGYFSLLNALFSLVVLVLLDLFSLEDSAPNNIESSDLPDFLIAFTSMVHTVCIGTLLYGVYTKTIEDVWIFTATLSTGINAGIFGITAAHELIHRKENFLQRLGIWNLFLTNYSHFYIEHRLGHHFKVGTKEDPATSRFGESFYSFLVRTIPGQYFSAWEIEANRNKRSYRKNSLIGNFVINGTVFQIIFIAILFFVFGWHVAIAFIGQSLVAIILLEYVNYIEHYGLVRAKGEKINALHAWQSDSITSRFTLFELSRHSDHHMKAYKPYHTLQSFDESPRLPYGYFGMFYIGLIPPLFFTLMNKRVENLNRVKEVNVS